MIAFFKFVWISMAILLIILVLLHSPKGDGLGAIGNQAQLFSSSRSAEQSLNRTTWTVAAVFLAVTVLLSAGWLTAATGG
ncbi:MAG: preprotein translocase subunit SecG [Synechococcaceae cyanobacterium SM2_3_1]|nr:preprotein translocase subunit SecG [Synechococcaceae cyanobacterium SM2_3_1]